jgi:hypothetical protein
VPRGTSRPDTGATRGAPKVGADELIKPRRENELLRKERDFSYGLLFVKCFTEIPQMKNSIRVLLANE